MYTPSSEFFQFVDAHVNEDPVRLRLKYQGRGEPWVQDAITHIECLHKCNGKFGDLQPELMLHPVSVEQASSARVARFHAEVMHCHAQRAVSLLDMTCGLGVDFAAMSAAITDDSKRCLAIELDERRCAVAQYNFRDREEVKVVNADSVQWLSDYKGDRFDVVFIDPARRNATGGRVFNLHDCQPDLIELIPLIASKSNVLIAKLSPMLDVTQTLRDLPQATHLYVVEERGECRELLAVADFSQSDAPCGLDAEIVATDCDKTFRFSLAEERQAEMRFGVPERGLYLYEPSPAMMKAAPFATLCARYGVRKLHPNSHVYVADSPYADLPGRWNKIADVVDFSSRSAKALSAKIGGAADVAVRNFPMRAEEFQKRFGFKGGDTWRVMATSLSHPRKNVLVLLEKQP